MATSPSEEEAAAIAAALTMVLARPVVVAEAPDRPPAWRFSGRWWRKPQVARRDRPWT